MLMFDAPYWPKRVFQGVGVYDDIVRILPAFPGKKCAAFVDPQLIDCDYVITLFDKFRQNDCAVSIFSDITPNPSDHNVKRAVDFLHMHRPDFLVYYGGGSTIDLGKAANVVYTHGGGVQDYEDLNGGIAKIKDILLPAIAIATTAGSGSEVSAVSVITDTDRRLKMGILSPYIVPTVSVLDALATVSMPSDLTAFTGMDALCHAIESYVSSVPFEPCRGIALKGVELVGRSLRKAVYDGGNLEARTDMLVGSACGAMAFNNNYLGAVHGCAHQLSSLADIPHGLANAIMLAPVIRWNIPSNVSAYADIGRAMGSTNLCDRQAAEDGLLLICQLADDIGIPRRLSEVGVTEDMINELVERAFIDHNMLTNPRKSNKEFGAVPKSAIRAMYKGAL